MTSPSTSGHQRMSLNDGSALFPGPPPPPDAAEEADPPEPEGEEAFEEAAAVLFKLGSPFSSVLEGGDPAATAVDVGPEEAAEALEPVEAAAEAGAAAAVAAEDMLESLDQSVTDCSQMHSCRRAGSACGPQSWKRTCKW